VPRTPSGFAQRIRQLRLSLPESRNPTAADWKSKGSEFEPILEEAVAETGQIEDLQTALFRLTQRESEVLHWVIQGKTNRDIGDILGMSPRTVNKHLEHVFEKLGVETRTAAATLATNRMRAGLAESP